jgi:hypothetical protein
LKNCLIKTISTAPLNWEAQSTVEVLTVEVSYEEYDVTFVHTGGSTLANAPKSFMDRVAGGLSKFGISLNGGLPSAITGIGSMIDKFGVTEMLNNGIPVNFDTVQTLLPGLPNFNMSMDSINPVDVISGAGSSLIDQISGNLEF